MRKYLETHQILVVSIIILVMMMLYPAWTERGINGYQVVYGSTLLMLGWLGFIMLYLPWYSIFPTINIIRVVIKGAEDGMRLSRIILFLFWLEGFIGVLGFKMGVPTDAGDSIIVSTGPSFWMWTILVWYILLYAFFYVRPVKEGNMFIFKILSALALSSTVIIVISYHMR